MFFESRETKEKKSILVHLLGVIAADGKIDDKERSHFINIGKTLGINDKEIHDIIANPSKVKIVIPEDEKTKVDHLGMLISMVGIDGDISLDEYAYCKLFAKNYGFDSKIVDVVIGKIISTNNLTVDGQPVK